MGVRRLAGVPGRRDGSATSAETNPKGFTCFECSRALHSLLVVLPIVQDKISPVFQRKYPRRSKQVRAQLPINMPPAVFSLPTSSNLRPMAAKMAPLQLVDLLNEVFQCFDSLVEKYDLEKIKTIGNCYMVASGVPRARSDHAIALVNLALDMQAAVAERRFGGRKLTFRIGINSGPVVAGIIGRKKFIYDLWGGAVNMASGMESHGRGRCVQVTCSTHELIADWFECEALGLIDVKGAGPTEVWQVVDRKPARRVVGPSH